MKIIWLADVPGWAFDNNAQQIAECLPMHSHKLIYMNGFENQWPLYIKTIIESEPDFVVIPHPWAFHHVAGLGYRVIFRNAVRATRVWGDYLNGKTDKIAFKEKIGKCVGVVCANSLLRQISLKANPNCYLCPNGVDTKLFTYKPRVKKNPGELFTIGYVANIAAEGMKYKCYAQTLNVIAKLQANNPKTYGTKFVIRTRNDIEHKDMAKDFYHQIDCLLHLTLDEGCSNVTGEALACGVPVITTRVGYHGENCRLPDIYDWMLLNLSDLDNINKICNIINTLANANIESLNDLAEQGRKFVELNQSPEVVAGCYQKIIEEHT